MNNTNPSQSEKLGTPLVAYARDSNDENSSQAGPTQQEMHDEPGREADCMDFVVTPFLSLLLCPFVAFGSLVQLEEKHELVVLRWGRYKGTYRDPGCHVINCIGAQITKVSLAVQSMDLPTNKMVDGNGNPLMVSGVLVYKIKNSFKAVIETKNYTNFLLSQAQAALKQVVSQYPYEDHNGGDSLKSEAQAVQDKLVQQLTAKVTRAGIEIQSFQFNELSYAPEVAAAMLKRQQAQALVVARKTIVQGAVETAFDAISQMEQLTGKPFSDDAREKITGNLLTVLCSENDAQPTVSV